MKLTFLGTGTSQGIPVIACECPVCLSDDPRDKRLRTSALLEVDGLQFVFDTGPDFRQQMLREKVKSLDAVVYTHQHMDHVSGLDDIRSFNFRLKRPMDLHANRATLDSLKQGFSYIFESPYPGIPQVILHEIEDDPFLVDGIEFLPIPVMHHKLPVLGFRVGDLAYITDANYISPSSLERLKGLKVLVLNALRRKKHLSHFNLKEALEMIDIIQPEKAYLTHLSHLMGKHADVALELPPNVEIAVDGLQISD